MTDTPKNEWDKIRRKLSTRAWQILLSANLKTFKQIKDFKKKHNFRELRNCGYVYANELCRLIKCKLEVTKCLECKRSF